MAKTLNPQVQKQQILNDLDTINDKYFAEAQSSITALVDIKVALHEHDKILDDQIDDFKARIVSNHKNDGVGYCGRQHPNDVSASCGA